MQGCLRGCPGGWQRCLEDTEISGRMPRSTQDWLGGCRVAGQAVSVEELKHSPVSKPSVRDSRSSLFAARCHGWLVWPVTAGGGVGHINVQANKSPRQIARKAWSVLITSMHVAFSLHSCDVLTSHSQ